MLNYLDEKGSYIYIFSVKLLLILLANCGTI